MKHLYKVQILALGLIALALPATSSAKNEGGERGESRMLMHLLEMDDAQLQQVRQTVERIEAMSPGERAAMRERLGKFKEMNAERRQALRERFEAIPEEERKAMRQRWFELSPEERREWRKKIRDMNPEERADAMKEAGLLPPKPRKRMPHEQGPPEGPHGPLSERKGPPPPPKN